MITVFKAFTLPKFNLLQKIEESTINPINVMSNFLVPDEYATIMLLYLFHLNKTDVMNSFLMILYLKYQVTYPRDKNDPRKVNNYKKGGNFLVNDP